MRVHLTNLGCKLNQAELEALARELSAAGHQVVERLDQADLHIVNTCTVTHRAARDSRKLARRGRRVDPRIRTVLTGCYATERPERASALEGVDLVVTNERKQNLLELIHRRFPDAKPDGPEGVPSPQPPPRPELDLGNTRFGHTRALVKIEDGCNVGCSFCIIPATRGRQHSRPPAEVVAEITALARAGSREVVITGVQISHYRWRRQGLFELVEAALEATAEPRSGSPRLRLTSIAPWRFDDRLLELLTPDRSGRRRLCRHFHLSLQSGSTATLRRMRRPYTAQHYAELVAKIRTAVPGIALTTDVIVGFPGETEEEFADSLAFVREMGFARTHVFPYSVREGTAAAELPGRVAHEVQRERMTRMLALAAELEEDFHRSQIGERLEVLWEERREGVWRGTTDNYLRVCMPEQERADPNADLDVDLRGRLGEVEITGLAEGEVSGRPLRS